MTHPKRGCSWQDFSDPACTAHVPSPEHQDTSDQGVLDKPTTAREDLEFSSQGPRVTNGGANEAHEATLQGNKQPFSKNEKIDISDHKTELLRTW